MRNRILLLAVFFVSFNILLWGLSLALSPLFANRAFTFEERFLFFAWISAPAAIAALLTGVTAAGFRGADESRATYLVLAGILALAVALNVTVIRVLARSVAQTVGETAVVFVMTLLGAFLVDWKRRRVASTV